MLNVLIELGAFNLLVVMSPGPDFAIVVKNTLAHSRRMGMFTALGIGSATIIHVTYCLLGLAVVLAGSPKALIVIGWLGGLYLIWLGIKALRSPVSSKKCVHDENKTQLSAYNTSDHLISDWPGFRQGFLTNLLNAKAIIFFIAMFSAMVQNPVSFSLGIAIAIELFCIVAGWFLLLAWLLSHASFQKNLERLMPYITQLMGVILILFGGGVIIESMVM